MSAFRVAVTDSGAGGLPVMKKIARARPEWDLVYVSDCENMPYGNKSEEQILRLCENNVKTAKRVGADFLVSACNTMSTVCGGVFACSGLPYFLVAPSSKKILKACDSSNGKVVLFCTERTAKSAPITQLSNVCSFFIRPQKNLAREIEKNLIEGKSLNSCVIEGESPLRVKFVFLGCTHYIYLKSRFKNVFKGAKIYDGTEKMIEFINRFADFKGLKQRGAGARIFLGSGAEAMLKIYSSF